MAKATKSQAGYLGPDDAPFKCGSCTHFDSKAEACELVSGTILSAGCCNLFNLEKHEGTSGAITSYYQKR